MTREAAGEHGHGSRPRRQALRTLWRFGRRQPAPPVVSTPQVQQVPRVGVEVEDLAEVLAAW